jgi:hypothetical protein
MTPTVSVDNRKVAYCHNPPLKGVTAEKLSNTDSRHVRPMSEAKAPSPEMSSGVTAVSASMSLT